MRVWCISLGMVGDDYAGARKMLVNPLEGDAGWRYGKPADLAANSHKNRFRKNPAITETIYEQILYIHDNGVKNIFDIREASEVAAEYKFSELQKMIEVNPRAYLTFILQSEWK